MKTQTIYRPARLLFLIPIVLLSARIDDLWVSLFFTLTLAWVTSKMFPVIDIVEVKEKESRRD